MIRITKTEKDYLVSKGYLKLKFGKYSDLHITCRQKKKGRKKYYVPDYFNKFINKMRMK